MITQLTIFDAIEYTKTSTKSTFESLIDELKKHGYSVRVKNVGYRKYITWTTKNHWASFLYDEIDLTIVCQKLQETIYNFSFTENN